MDTLKHILLRELKSSSDGTIDVMGTTYNEEDIQRILDANNSKNSRSFNPESFLATFPELKAITSEGKIHSYFKGDLDAFQSYEHQTEAQDYLTSNYSDIFEEEINSHLDKFEFMPAAQRVTHLFAFTAETQKRIKENIKNKVSEILQSDKTNFQFITWEPYYKILQIISESDNTHLEKQYHKGFEQLGNFSYDQGSTFFKRQLTLNFSESFKSKIENDETNFFNEKKGQSSKSYNGNSLGSNGEISWRTIYFAFILPIKIIFILVKCMGGPDTAPDPSQDQVIRQFMERQNENNNQQRNRRIYTKEEIDSINTRIRRIREIRDSLNQY